VSRPAVAWQSRQFVPDIILAPAEFDLYLDATKRLKDLFYSLAPSVQIFSLDEAFIDITDCLDYLHPDPLKLAHSIQRQIKHQLGGWVNCNIGIGKNRFLAKLVSEVSPKSSVTVINDQNQDQYLSTSDFSSVCGIGFRLEKRLKLIGIDNLYAINFVSDEDLFQHFGPFWSIQLRRMARGLEPHFSPLSIKTPI